VGISWNFHGATTFKDLIDAKNSLLSSPEERKKLRYMIVDITSMETVNPSFEETKELRETSALRPSLSRGCSALSFVRQT